MNFAALPPEINSGRMYAGAGSGPMISAATAWDGLAAEMHAAATSYSSVVSGLTHGPWLGPASVSMVAAAAPYATWLSTAAEQAKQAGTQARSAAVAYEAAFAATVPPPVIAENRALLMSLVATNILGQNTPAIAATETQYAEMWAQDATAMYGYASGSAAASTLTPFSPPPQTTNPAGTAVQAAAVGQAAGASAAAPSASALSRLVSTVPTLLQTLASGTLSLPAATDLLNFSSGVSFVASGVLFILGPALTGPVKAALPVASAIGPGLGSAAALMSDGAPGLGGTAVLAGAGRAASIGGMSVPPAWAAAAPEIGRAATAVPQPALAALTESRVGGLGPGYGAMLPGGLMAAAAGAGGAAGGGWGATRGGQAGQPRAGTTQSGDAPRFRYIPPPTVLPPGARETDVHAPPAGRAMRTEVQGAEAPSRDTLRDELNELRKQVAQLATEREVLMRSLALWARESTGQ